MSGRLMYVVGPSGAGKDSLLAWLRQHTEPMGGVHFAQRVVDRPVQPGGEQHESLDAAEFEAARLSGDFCLHWQANGRRYGVRPAALAPLAQGDWVFLNGSRAHVPVAQMQYPDLVLLHITASPEVLHQRLLGRGRESPAEIAARLRRAAQPLPPAAQLLTVCNDGSLEESGERLLRMLCSLAQSPVVAR